MILVIDIGTTSLRVAAITPDGRVHALRSASQPPHSPLPGLVEFDPSVMASTMLEMSHDLITDVGSVDAVGVTAQRASTVVWDRRSGEPIGPGLGWQDLRTVGECIGFAASHGIAVAPNQSATKAAWLLDQHDPERRRDLCVGTVDSWAIWTLTRGASHVTDHTNAAVTGWYSAESAAWDSNLCDLFRVPISMLPAISDSIGMIGEASALPGSPPIMSVLGDQQASLVGQGCVRRGDSKITFGTGGMLDVCTGDDDRLLRSGKRSNHGCFGIVGWSQGGRRTFGAEAIMLAAGSNVDWLRDDLGLISTSADSHDLASAVPTSDGVVFVPAPLGLGTPAWDYGARSSMFGLTRGSTAAHVVRAVLDGVAHRGADLVDAVEADLNHPLASIRIDGGMSRNPTFVQLLANAVARPIEVAPHTECTTVGAGLLAAVGVGHLGSVEELADLWRPEQIVEPSGPSDRERWLAAVARSSEWIPELSALDF